MTREEAVKIMQLNKGWMNGSVQAALAVLLPELDERQKPQDTVIKWRTCKAGDHFTFKALIRYPAYAEIGYYAKADGDWVPMEDIEQEKICATCAYYSARTRWEGRCQRHGSTASLPPDDTCDLWEPYDTSNVEKKEGGNG